MRNSLVVLICVATLPLAASLPTFAQPQPMPPGVMWDSLLASVTMYSNTGNATLAGFERLVAVFLPPATSRTEYPYNPDDGGKFWAILSSADGTQLARYDFWSQERPAPYWYVDDAWVTDLATGARIETRQIPLPPGQYVADYFLESGRIYTFPFSVSKLDSDDPFRPQSFWFLDGPWQDWGCLTYSEGDPGQTLQWLIFLRNKGREASKDVALKVAVTRDADGATVCTTRPGMTWSLMREWKPLRFELVSANEIPFRAADLLARDGAYTLRMTIDGQTYGTWKFQVAGGALQYAGRTVRGAVDPTQFVEGGPTQWWYIRQESGQASGGAGAAAPAAPGATTGGAQAATTGGTAGGTAQATGAPELIPGGAPIQVNGVTMVPLRAIFEWLGAEIKFIAQANTIIAQRGDTVVSLRTDSTTAYVNGQQRELAQQPVQRDGTTYIPLRFVAEAFGCQVAYDAASATVTITDGERVGQMSAQ